VWHVERVSQSLLYHAFGVRRGYEYVRTLYEASTQTLPQTEAPLRLRRRRASSLAASAWKSYHIGSGCTAVFFGFSWVCASPSRLKVRPGHQYAILRMRT
jgi:hypothetical protein